MTKNISLLIICVLFAVSCNKVEVPEKLHNVLLLAGDNKDELLKTISHYQNLGDSLKLKAAYFLIENLENKYSYIGESYHNLRNVIASYCLDTIKDVESLKKSKDNIENELSIYSTFEYSKIADAKHINSNYLINYIDESFQALEMPWIKGKISFEQFCKYVLPYKVGDEPIEDWRSTVIQDYRWLIDSLSHAHSGLIDVAQMINTEIAKRFEAKGASKISLSFGYSDLKKMKVGSCYNAVSYTMYVMRALGIPIGMDTAPIWGNRSGGHQWTVLYLPEGNTVPFDPTYDFQYFADRFHPKINRTVLPPKYAVTTKIHSIPFEIVDNKYSSQEDIPPLFKRNFLDVTDRYTSTSDITIKPQNIPSDLNYAYLFVFDINNWVPVQISSISSDRTLSFKKMGNGVVYLPGFLNSNNEVPCDYPFVQNRKGEIRKFIPHKDKLMDVILYRKYPYLERVKSFADRMRGGIFQVANSPDFVNPVILYRIAKTPEPYYQEVVLKKSGAYRYFRYLPPDSSYGDVAEIEVYTSTSKEPIYGNMIGTKGESESCSIEKAFDHDKLSYYTSLRPNGNWVGIDFGEKIRIAKIRFLPRNDQNTIESGDDYELFYWDNQWISLGVQRAKKQYLKYTVPENALLWLRNLTRGKEERIFTYENGRQVWW